MNVALLKKPVVRTIDSLLSIIFKPLHWLERARGRWRLLLLFVYALVLGVVGMLAWRVTSLWGLPDVEPFDVAEFEKNDVPDAENAYASYEAAARLIKLPSTFGTGDALPDRLFDLPWSEFRANIQYTSDYNYMTKFKDIKSPRVADTLETNAAALKLWKRGAACDRIFPKDRFANAALSGANWPNMSFLGGLAELKASRLQEDGDLAGSWEWLVPLARSTRHLNAKDFVPPHKVLNILAHLRFATDRWLADPGLDPKLLRRAVREIVEAEQIRNDDTDAIKTFYFEKIKEFDLRDPNGWLQNRRDEQKLWYQFAIQEADVRWYLKREPERSRRLLKLLFANWIAAHERDPNALPALKKVWAWYWKLDETAPPAARFLDPQEFNRWFDSSMILLDLDLFSVPAFEEELIQIQEVHDELVLMMIRKLFLLEQKRPHRSMPELMKLAADDLPKAFRDSLKTRSLKSQARALKSQKAQQRPVNVRSPILK